jgi:hypothetical protein
MNVVNGRRGYQNGNPVGVENDDGLLMVDSASR